MVNLKKELQKIQAQEDLRKKLEERLEIKRLKDFNQKRINLLKSQIKNTEKRKQAIRALKSAGRVVGKTSRGAGRIGFSIIRGLQKIADEQNQPVRRSKRTTKRRRRR